MLPSSMRVDGEWVTLEPLDDDVEYKTTEYRYPEGVMSVSAAYDYGGGRVRLHSMCVLWNDRCGIDYEFDCTCGVTTSVFEYVDEGRRMRRHGGVDLHACPFDDKVGWRYLVAAHPHVAALCEAR